MNHEPSNKLFLKGVPLHVKEKELCAWLALEEFIKDFSVKEIIDGRTNSRRGWWLATFQSAETATAVMAGVKGRALAGNSIGVKYSS